MTISIDRYIQITSGVAGGQSVAQRELVGLRFTSDPRVPLDAVISMGKGDADAYFGAGSPEATFANQYFGYISPAPASQAQKIRFAAYADVARPPRIYGVKTGNTVTAFNRVKDGSLHLTLGGTVATLGGIDLSAAKTFAEIASAVQGAVRAHAAGGKQWADATVTYDAVAAIFTLTGGVAEQAAVGIDAKDELAQLLGWGNALTIRSPGSLGQTPLEALQAVENITDSFGSLSFPVLNIEQAVPLAQYNAALNVKYMLLVAVNETNAEAWHAALRSFPSTGLILSGIANQYKEAIPAAIMAATNYQRRNATVNYMYRQVPGMTPEVSSNQLANLLDGLRVNYYGETANAGQKIAFFQRGYLLGDATAPLDMNVHANEQWFKAFLTARLLSLQLSVGKIPANNDGRGMVLGQVIEAVNLARFNGTIIVGKDLDATQQVAITQLSGDPDAWRDVQINGFWADVRIVPRSGESGVTEYVAQYAVAYSKNDVVRKIEGSHNLI
ncbi:DUF3383 domain-containing protein [Pseudomonas sp. 21LCFQ010]|uniref:DUF3383 domain-containing protein n=1 Tax=Pseudomonas sp. 21LCFQ010 TaxID=2957506 RepID=UPI002096CC32|nr:DUF3383 domain-containing protein [Pseudomonas sp. 21LCFQ010]MCO8160976.1 DUF3383 domain-containing protein [Pseudomonas sp. 21LCFQ010]